MTANNRPERATASSRPRVQEPRWQELGLPRRIVDRRPIGAFRGYPSWRVLTRARIADGLRLSRLGRLPGHAGSLPSRSSASSTLSGSGTGAPDDPIASMRSSFAPSGGTGGFVFSGVMPDVYPRHPCRTNRFQWQRRTWRVCGHLGAGPVGLMAAYSAVPCRQRPPHRRRRVSSKHSSSRTRAAPMSSEGTVRSDLTWALFAKGPLRWRIYGYHGCMSEQPSDPTLPDPKRPPRPGQDEPPTPPEPPRGLPDPTDPEAPGPTLAPG